MKYNVDDYTTAMVCLSEAIDLADAKGYQPVGLTIQYDREQETYAIWLYTETEEEQIPIFGEVSEGSTMTEAAQGCLQAVVELQHGLQVEVGEA